MSSFSWPPTGSGNQIAEYANFAAFPSAASAGNGAFALALDTDILYVSNGTSWLAIAGPGAVLSLGTFGAAPNASGGVISSNTLTLEPADGTHPGGVSILAQTFGGNKTFLGTISASNLSGTNTGDVTIGTANGLSITGQVLSLGLSSTSTTGALSSTDWNTFNNKQAAGNYITALTGDGTASGPGSVPFTLAIVNANVGSFTLASITVNAKGLITAASSGTTGDLTDAGTDGITITGGTGAVIGAGTSIAQHVADATHNGYLSLTDWNTFNNKQAAGNYITALTGDVTASGPGSAAATLATVNANVGSFGSSTAIPNFTVNAKGLITAAGTNAVIAPAGTLTGTTLAANVVTSSLTTVGTIATGVWQGTAVTVPFGGTGDTSFTAYAVICGGTTSTGPLQNVSGVGTSGQVLTSNGASALPTWQSASGATVISARASGTVTGGSGSAVIIVFPSVDWDTNSAYNSSTGRFTVPTGGAGYYHVNTYINASSGATIMIYKNGSSDSNMCNSGGGVFSGSGVVKVADGDIIDIRPNASIGASGSGCFLSFTRF